MSNNEYNTSQEGLTSGVSSTVPQGYAAQQQHHGQTLQLQQSHAARQHGHPQHQNQQPVQHFHHHQHQQPPRLQQQHPLQQHENQNQRYGLCLSVAAAPALPPRPGSTINRLMVHSTLDFPPPPRTPNKPPKLPPRPSNTTHGPTKQTPYSHQQAGYPTTAPHAQSLLQTWASHGQSWAPPPPPALPLASPPVQGETYPLLPPRPPPPTSPITTVPPIETPFQPRVSFQDSHVSPPPPYAAVSTIAPAERNEQHLYHDTGVLDLLPPAPKAMPPSATSYDHIYQSNGLQQAQPTPESLPHLAPGINTPVTDTTVANENCLPSMIDRLNLRQVDAPVSPPNSTRSTSFTAELSCEPPTPSLKPDAEKLDTSILNPVPRASPTPRASNLPPRPGPCPAFVTDVPDNAPCTILPALYTQAPLPPATQPLVPDGSLEECTKPAQPSTYTSLPREQCMPQIKSRAVSKDLFYAQPVSTAHQSPVQSPRTPSLDIHEQTATAPDKDSPLRDLTAGILLKPVTHCIDTPVTFPTWWYSHHSAPDYSICSKCYMDKVYPTVFQNHFDGRYVTDGAERRCRFNVPRIIDQLLPDAVSRRTVDTLVSFMSQRVQIADCKGVAGALGSEGIKWYTVKNHQIPGLVACEACYHDVVCMSQFAFKFEQCTGQAKNDTWACDICVPFIRKEFELRTKNDDWPSFINEAKARIGMPACPKNSPIAFGARKWFVPIKGQGPPDAVLCVACYCDYILKSGQEVLWEQETQNISHATKTTNTCMTGMFHLRMALFAADEKNEWPLFWSVLNRIAYQEKPCVGDGILDGNWYTLPSQPVGYNVCGACHAGIVQSLHMNDSFVARTTHRPTPNEAHLCAFNVKSQRFASYVRLMLQTWFTADCTAWDAYASRYAAVPTCPRNVDYRNRAWYGWPECVICADCYVDFVHGTAFDTPERMTFHSPVILEEPHICEMYSPRMRQLYQQACLHSPPSATQLFAQAEHRRLVYWQTIPQCRELLMQEKLLANNISMARTSGVFYNAAGGLAAVGRNNHYTYGAAGVGYGYQNALQLTGAQYNAQANAMSAQLGGSKILIVGQLEQQWLAVE